LPSPESPLFWLLAKEWRELVSLKAWWVLLLAMGPLAGMSFISSARTYAEVSGLNGTSAGVGEALAPLTGIWAPTFSACELAAVFLLPFVAIGLVAGDRQSGALRLELQQPLGSPTRTAAKAVILLAGWLIAMLPPLSAILLWKSYGGSAWPPELITLTLGHILNAGLTIGLASAMASLTAHPSTAAILTLGVTIGTWIVSFFGAIQGGWWERAAGYTPAAMVAQFQHGLIRLDVLFAALILTITGLGLAAVWMRLGQRVSRRVFESAGIGLLAACLLTGCTLFTPSWDTSESRSNSFPEADEQALRTIHEPLSIVVHLAPEDPRRVDLETRALAKLRRAMPQVQVRYESATSIGLFEQSRPGYGEIWYNLAGRKTMSRVTTAEGILEAIYAVARITPPVESQEDIFRGHPLPKPPYGAAILFYAIWPGIFLAAAIFLRRRIE
jgi:ABC-2 type transport system permease protein